MAMGAISRWWDRRDEKAELIAYLLSPHSKRPVDPKKISKRPTKKASEIEDKHAFAAAIRRLEEKIEKRKHGA